MKPTIILFLFSIFFSSHVFAWTVSADFEYGPPDPADIIADLPNLDAFHDTAGQSRYADTPALSGSKSGSVTAHEGETGFGRWGGGHAFPETLGEGDEVWYRVNVYYPTGWDFSCAGCNQGVKFMRIVTDEGQISTLIGGGVGVSGVSAGTTGGLINVDSEVNNGFYDGYNTKDGNNSGASVYGLGTPIIRDQWHTYEMYVKFSSVQGQGIYRIWQDGNLIFEDLKSGTLLSPTSKATRTWLYTYWNGGAPKTQTSYVDDIIITNEVPGRKDAHGNSYIGVGASIYIAPPKAPPSVSGQ